jgi:hypothetical protein
MPMHDGLDTQKVGDDHSRLRISALRARTRSANMGISQSLTIYTGMPQRVTTYLF